MSLLLRILRGIKSIFSPSNLKEGYNMSLFDSVLICGLFFPGVKWWRVARNRGQRKNKSDEGRRKSFCSPTPPCLSNPACSWHQDQLGRADREKLHENREQKLSMARLSLATTSLTPPPPHRATPARKTAWSLRISDDQVEMVVLSLVGDLKESLQWLVLMC